MRRRRRRKSVGPKAGILGAHYESVSYSGKYLITSKYILLHKLRIFMRLFKETLC